MVQRGLTNEERRHCVRCGMQTKHLVSLRIVTETPGKKHSREPYRMTTCGLCGDVERRRV